jgi:hypothetical protein
MKKERIGSSKSSEGFRQTTERDILLPEPQTSQGGLCFKGQSKITKYNTSE